MSDADDADSQDNINGELEPEEHVETIERVMESRIGKKGGVYCVFLKIMLSVLWFKYFK